MVLFEDKEDDLLSKLFRAAYPENITKYFKYCNGNAQLPIEAEKLLKTGEKVIVYLDSVPGNKHIIDVYNELYKLHMKYGNKLIVYNIVCAEYYFLKAFGRDKDICIKQEDLDIVLNRDIYYHSSVIQTTQDKAYAKNFEKYCKLVLMKNYSDCVRHSRGSEENNDINGSYGYFYEQNCKCIKNYDSCVTRTLRQKALNYIRQYPCLPSGYFGSENNKILDYDGIVLKHRQLVDSFNLFIDKYNNDSETIKRRKTVKHIKYMM